MHVEFHCGKCGKLIRAPQQSSGKQGKCPYCKQSVYIPMPPDAIEEIPLAPLNDEPDRQHEELDEEAERLVASLGDADSGEKDAGSRAGAAPARGAADRVEEQNRDAVGETHEQCDVRRVGDQAVRLRRLLPGAGKAGQEDPVRMHLVEFGYRLRIPAEMLEYDAAIAGDRFRIVTHRGTEVQGFVRRAAGPSPAGQDGVAQTGGDVSVRPPIDLEVVGLHAGQDVLAFRVA